MAFKKIRNMKVYEQSGYHYKSTPTIMLKGQWLNELGCRVQRQKAGDYQSG